jgi:RimJ/RimL family protein N-acetyltransferase
VSPLETARLRLEPLAPVHVPALREIWSDPEVARFLLSRPSSDAELEAIVARNLAAAEGRGAWAVVLREGARVVGRVAFFDFGDARRPELAFLLARGAWGRGLATEACRAAVRFGFGMGGFAEIVALVRPGNGAALGVLRRLGMQLEARPHLAGGPAELHRLGAPGLPEPPSRKRVR